MSDQETRIYTYDFELADGTNHSFTVTLAFPSMQIVDAPPAEPAPWTALAHHQCSHCPLNEAEHPHCPVALRLQNVIATFKACNSLEAGYVTVHTANRRYSKIVPVTRGLSALMGMIMTASGCPHLNKLRPMVYTHLPFATMHETLYRAISMYLVAQYLREREGREPDWELLKLDRIYADINMVNMAFSERLRSIDPADASLNAVVNLDCFGSYTVMFTAGEFLEELKVLFASHLQE